MGWVLDKQRTLGFFLSALLFAQGFGRQSGAGPLDCRPFLFGVEMPLTKKGKKIKRAMKKQYGKEKGEQVFYASQNKGTIKGTHKKRKKRGS